MAPLLAASASQSGLVAGEATVSAGDAYLSPGEGMPITTGAPATMSLPIVAQTSAHGNEILLPEPAAVAQCYILGRDHGPGIIRIVDGWNVETGLKVSKQHAELRITTWGEYELRDSRSLNGTMIYREDPLRATREEIHVNGDWVTVEPGDFVRFGSIHYEWRQEGDRVRLVPSDPEMLQQLARDVSAVSRPQVVERPLMDRLQEAQRQRREVELFVADSKEKHVGRILRVEGTGESAVVHFQEEDSRNRYTLGEILTVRNRNIDLTNRYVHHRLTIPQFRDRSINVSGSGTRQVVLVDFEDPRLTRFLEIHMQPIRQELDAGDITEREAAVMAWRVVRDYVPYDYDRLAVDMPYQMYRLGDFIEQGVCNERGMLLQVSLQYVGIRSRMEKGPVPGGRHAWTRAYVDQRDGGPRVRLILDPQRSRALEVGVNPEAEMYHDDQTPFAQERAMTVVFDHATGLTARAEQNLRAEGVDPEQVEDNLLEQRSEKLQIEHGSIRWEQIETLRREQTHNRLWLMTDTGGELTFNQPYEKLNQDQRLGEQRAALEVYRQISDEVRTLLWGREGTFPDGLLPEFFLERYYDMRVALHEEGEFEFGQTEWLVEAILGTDLLHPRRLTPVAGSPFPPAERAQRLAAQFAPIQIGRSILPEVLGRPATIGDLIQEIGTRRALRILNRVDPEQFIAELFRAVGREDLLVAPTPEPLSLVQAVPWAAVRAFLGEELFPSNSALEASVRSLGDLVRELGTRRSQRLRAQLEAAQPEWTGEALERAYVAEVFSTVFEDRYGPLPSTRRNALMARIDQALS